jgi:hypothetical protein
MATCCLSCHGLVLDDLTCACMALVAAHNIPGRGFLPVSPNICRCALKVKEKQQSPAKACSSSAHAAREAARVDSSRHHRSTQRSASAAELSRRSSIDLGEWRPPLRPYHTRAHTNVDQRASCYHMNNSRVSKTNTQPSSHMAC